MWGWKFGVPNFMEQDHGDQNVSLGPGLRLSLDSGGRPGFRQGTGLSGEAGDGPLAGLWDGCVQR